MNQRLKYISRIKDEFDTVICGVNGVLLYGDAISSGNLDALIAMYQNGKKIALASNTGMRVRDLYYFLKRKNVPMNIFYAMITAGEIAHFYLRNNQQLGRSYFNLSGKCSYIMDGLDYKDAESLVFADFILAETDVDGVKQNEIQPLLEQSLHLRLPLICVGNNTALMGKQGLIVGAGAVAEQYAMMGGQVVSFGKPDVRIAKYLLEGTKNIGADKCLVIGDCMSTDMRMGNSLGAKTLFMTDGVHQLGEDTQRKLDNLTDSYGLNVDYYTEALQW